MFEIGTGDQQPLHAAAFHYTHTHTHTHTHTSFLRSEAQHPPVWEIHTLMTLQLPRFRFAVFTRAK